MPSIARKTLERDLLAHVGRPGRYTGGELNSTVKDWTAARARFALVFPDAYEIGMSHVGLRIIYAALNAREDTLAERAYSPWADAEAVMRERGLPLFSLESHRPLSEFDVIAFSLPHETCYTNVLAVLDLAGVPLRSADRDAAAPLVIAGGCGAYIPEPAAPFIDAFAVGDGEEVILDITDVVAAKLKRADTLRELAKIDGVYVPSLYTPSYNADGTLAAMTPSPGAPALINRRLVDDLDSAAYPERPVVSDISAVHDRLTLEIMRGCTQGCRFCQAGMLYRPVRERSVERLLHLARTGLAATGYDEVSLLSLSTGDYSRLPQLLSGLLGICEPARVGLAVSSLRADADAPELASVISRVRKSGFTLAPESGSERLRRVINKKITEQDLDTALTGISREGWRSVKLYFMIGLPTETEADIEETVRMVNDVARARTWRRVTVSVSSFVPKAHTPFQWDAMDDLAALRDKQAYLRSAIHGKRVKLKWHQAEMSHLEGVFARGDRRLADAIEAAFRFGARFDAWSSDRYPDAWTRAFDQTGIDPAFYANRVRPYDELLPWDHISTGVSREYFRAERERALRGEITPDCRDGCTGCGACTAGR